MTAAARRSPSTVPLPEVDFQAQILRWMARIDERLHNIDARIDVLTSVVQGHGTALADAEQTRIERLTPPPVAFEEAGDVP